MNKITITFGLLLISFVSQAATLTETISSSIDSDVSVSNNLVQDWALLTKAQKLIDSGQVTNSIEGVSESSELSFYKKVLQAQNAFLQNQTLKAIELLANLPEAPVISLSEEANFYRKLYYKAVYTKKKALEKLGRNSNHESETLWAYFPDFETPVASEAPPSGAKAKSYVERIHVLFVLKEWGALVALISDIDKVNFGSLKSEDKCQVSYEWAEAQRQVKNASLAAKGFAQVTNFDCQGEILSRSLFWKAKYEVIAKKTAEAIKTYERYIHLFPSQRYTDDAYHSLSSLYEKSGATGKAKAAMNKLLGLSKGDMKAKVLWEDGYEAFKKKQYTKAVTNFDRIIAMSGTNDEYQPQAMYWKARSLEMLKKSGDAKALYSRLVRDFNFSFYNVLAKHRLGVSLSSLSSHKMSSPSGGLLSLVDSLNKAHKNDEALEVLDYFAQTERERAAKDLPLMAAKYLDSGNYHRAMMLAHDYFGSVPSSAIFDKGNQMIAALFPLAYQDSVLAAAKKSGLPRGVIEGIMREESLFQPEIQSHAGAKGLMQLMPATAAMQANSSGISGYAVSRLSDPQLNITLGADFFAKMVNQFNGQIPLAIMAYNAGPGNVRKWLKTNGHLPLDEFVEEIPFSETRGYIKRVLRSMQVYGLIHNEERLKKPFVSLKIKS